jgi:hypothetical protein
MENKNTLIAGYKIIITNYTISSSSGGGGSDITQKDLDLKQDKLSVGKNITIDANNVISSRNATQSQLDTKQTI